LVAPYFQTNWYMPRLQGIKQCTPWWHDHFVRRFSGERKWLKQPRWHDNLDGRESGKVGIAIDGLGRWVPPCRISIWKHLDDLKSFKNISYTTKTSTMQIYTWMHVHILHIWRSLLLTAERAWLSQQTLWLRDRTVPADFAANFKSQLAEGRFSVDGADGHGERIIKNPPVTTGIWTGIYMPDPRLNHNGAATSQGKASM
jgi:hypothetical protein